MNKLASETSPYLLQHADNPVHWYPWGEEALARARSEDKPILLSIGYSACHWCHVMAHESFEDETTAELMNRLFINIKVDREERPDLDKIYQTAHSMLTQRPGGWPLTVFLAPIDHMPIFAGTYFPDQPRHGMPAFSQVMQQIHDIYHSRRDDIARQSDSLRAVFQRIAEHDAGNADRLTAMPLDVARNQIEQQFDSVHGGYSGAPKFPHPAIVERALHHWARTAAHDNPDQRILHTALFTLERMAESGLFDHLGGGFCRYATDEQWMIPHFEKMLYDNGPLLKLNTYAWLITGDPTYRDAAVETAEWVLRDMQSPEGGYYSSLDADSEGVEGKFYAWTPDEVRQHIDADSYPLFARRFGLDREANFEGHWHLHAYVSIRQLAEETGLEPESLREQLRTARRQLFEVREQRVHPGRDDKILTSWNGLMIEGMAVAGRYLDKSEYIDSAERAARFIKNTLWQQHRLLATCKDGKAHLNAYLDDYAFLLAGVLELLQSRWHSEWLNWACELADVLIEQFEQPDRGGFYFTSHDHEQLIQRSKLYSDDATPSGNGVAARALLDLGYLTANTRYLDAAERCLKAAWNSISSAAISHCTLLDALDDWLNPPQLIIVRGMPDAIQTWQRRLTGHYRPHTRVYTIPADATLPDSLKDKKALGEACAYICTGMQCSAPVTQLSELEAASYSTGS